MELNVLTLFIAFGAGVLSFISPCCVPLVPAYLGYMTGMSVDELRTAEVQERARLAVLAAAFVLGLAVISPSWVLRPASPASWWRPTARCCCGSAASSS